MEKRMTYTWNTVSYILYALQSAIMMYVISHYSSVNDSGIFTAGYAIANLFLCIANFNMRNYQVADIKKRYSFQEYKFSRVVTISLSFVSYIVYIIVVYEENEYTKYRCIIFLLIFVMKIVEAGEDVYHGFYQVNGKLIDAAKLLSLRLGTMYVFFFLIMILTNDIILSLLTCVIFTLFFALITNIVVLKKYEKNTSMINFDNVMKLLRSCLPLCVSQFLLLYIANAPKYAMINIVSDELQAYYGYLSLPVFTIALLSNVIYVPQLTHFAYIWEEKKVKLFIVESLKRCLCIFIITFAIIVFGYFIGLRLLGGIYGVNLLEYRIVFMILLISGGMSAVCSALNYFIIVIGAQKLIVFAYSITAFTVFMCSKIVINYKGILGAAILMLMSYVLLSIELFGIFSGKILVNCKKMERN